jgi:hypothetical protein
MAMQVIPLKSCCNIKEIPKQWHTRNILSMVSSTCGDIGIKGVENGSI